MVGQVAVDRIVAAPSNAQSGFYAGCAPRELSKMHSAQHVYATAPLGSLVRYGNGKPRPPEHDKRKLRAWENENGVGRLIERCGPSESLAAHFIIHVGDFEREVAVMMMARRIFFVGEWKIFEIVETPAPGAVRVLFENFGQDELCYLASDVADAEQWMAVNGSAGMRIEIVPDPDPVTLPETA